MTSFSWPGIVEEGLALVEIRIDEALESNTPILKEMANHIIDAGGKRVRPGLLLTIYKALGGEDISEHVRIAAAFEIIHTGTLIHDDINDGSERRRGLEAVHVKYGLQNAIVAGDFMFTKAFQLASSFTSEIKKIMLDACVGLAEGEIIQQRWKRGGKMSISERNEVSDLKTALPMAAVSFAGAYHTEHWKTKRSTCFDLGMNLGRAFQLKDDLMDIEGDPETTGKPVMQDLLEGNLTSPILYAYEKADPKDAKSMERLISDPENGDMEELRDIIRRNGGITYLKEQMEYYRTLCKNAIDTFPENVYSASLSEIVDYVVQREF